MTITQWQNNILDTLRQMERSNYEFAYTYIEKNNMWELTPNIDFWLLLKAIATKRKR